MVNVENVTFAYTKHYNLFDNISLQLEPGNIYGLLGKNGTGKTTLFKLMTGVLMPQQGSCQVFNKDATKRIPSALSEYFIIPEEFLLPSIKMNDFVKINAPLYPKFSHEDFNEYLQEFEMSGNKRLQTLSFGQKKKFLLAFGLATNVKLLFLDEPTNGLDIPSKSQFRKTVAKALSDEKSIIISTHQARDLESLIDTIIILEDGKVIFKAPCSTVTQNLSFGKARNIEETEELVYKEDTVGGYKVMTKAGDEDETDLDLELFFNAVVNERQKVIDSFNQNN